MKKPKPQKLQEELQQLLQQPNIWQASRVQRTPSVLATGYSTLDRQLHYGGWLDNATTELLLPQPGLGELRLLLPSLRHLQAANRPWLVFIDPTFEPYAPAFKKLGLDPSGILIIKPRNNKDLLWSAEQVLQSGCCGAVLTWTDDLPVNNQQLRRLQHAAHRGQSWHILLRADCFIAQPSPSATRLRLNSRQDGLLHLHVLKQRGGWSGQQIALRLQSDLSQLHRCSPEELLLGNKATPTSDAHNVQPGKIISFPAMGS